MKKLLTILLSFVLSGCYLKTFATSSRFFLAHNEIVHEGNIYKPKKDLLSIVSIKIESDVVYYDSYRNFYSEKEPVASLKGHFSKKDRGLWIGSVRQSYREGKATVHSKENHLDLRDCKVDIIYKDGVIEKIHFFPVGENKSLMVLVNNEDLVISGVYQEISNQKFNELKDSFRRELKIKKW